MQWNTIVLSLTGELVDADRIRCAIPDDADLRTHHDVEEAARAVMSSAIGAGQRESSDRFGFLLVFAGTAETTYVAEVIARLRATAQHVPIVLVTKERAPGDILTIIAAGCDEFAHFPICPQLLRARLERLFDAYYRTDPTAVELSTALGVKHIIGESAPMQAIKAKIPIFSKCDASVLIDGETGTGKEVCARAIHYLSPRVDKAFVPVNCGALPLDLVENELFGHERAAYTGASVAAKGLVAEADGGTLFLDEIDALPPKAQVKLLRLLQDKEYRPLGSPRYRRVDVRFIAATNFDLTQQYQNAQIRDDLFFRISVLRLTMPPLRDREQDVLLLADHFLDKFSIKQGRRPLALTPAARQSLLHYHWPGNVRELEHVIERAVVLAESRPAVAPEDLQLPGTGGEQPAPSFRAAKQRVVARFESNYLRAMLAAHRGNVARAAAAAGKDPRALRHLIRKHNIDVQAYRATRG
jgi:two-component system response regulator GlrR